MLNCDQSVFTSSTDFGTSGNLSFVSGPRVPFGIGSPDPLLGPEVSSRGGGSCAGNSTSGMSGADAFPESSRPTGTGASRGWDLVFRGTIDVNLQLSLYVCESCPRGFGRFCPLEPM